LTAARTCAGQQQQAATGWEQSLEANCYPCFGVMGQPMYVWVFHLSPSLLFIMQNQLNKVVFAHLYNITILISRFSTCELDAVDADGALL
jgi:hypothetical protein